MIIKIIKSYLPSVEVNMILKVTDFVGTSYIFYLQSQYTRVWGKEHDSEFRPHRFVHNENCFAQK